jgi:DNA-binding LytR/AlgR family response regulator
VVAVKLEVEQIDMEREEDVSAKSSLFRCSKSMILNADKIDYIHPLFSGRFEAVLSNGEAVIVSRKYVADLKRLFGI